MEYGNNKLKPDGIFGKWVEDEHGLPAYEYTCDQDAEPAAEAFTTQGPSRLHWHQVGNHRLNAIATNRGEVQLMEASRGLQWLNYFDPGKLCPGGGIALVGTDDGPLRTDLYFMGAPRRGYRRIFGAGYFRKISVFENLEVDHCIVFPFGDDPVAVAQISVTNNGAESVRAQVYEFFGVNLHYMSAAPVYTTSKRKHFTPWKAGNTAAGTLNMALAGAADSEGRRRSFASRFRFAGEIMEPGLLALIPEYTGHGRPQREASSSRNYYPLPMFMAAAEGSAEKIFFRSKSLLDEDGRFRDKPWAAGGDSAGIRRPCLCMGGTFGIPPGETRKLSFVFGCCEKNEMPALAEKYLAAASGADFRETNAEEWKKHLPVFELPGSDENEWVSRETAWHGYYSHSAFMRDDYYGVRFAPQGGAYEYLHGYRGAVRDLALYIAGLVYLAPQLARDLLRYCFMQMTPGGRIMYAAYGYGKATGAVVHDHPSDLQLFLFYALAEYVFFTGDTGILDQEDPYHGGPGERATVLEKTLVALEYLCGKIGLGAHGLVRVGDGDWSDGISLFVGNRMKFVRYGESVFNSAMAQYVLPRLADLLEARAPGAAKKARDFAAGLREPVLKCFNGKWFYRAYDGSGRPVGDDHLFLEHHNWLLISRTLPEEMAQSVVSRIHNILDRPSAYGQYVLYPPKKTLFDQYAPGWDVNGGIWYAMNYLLCWGYSRYDREKAWEAFRKNSMAAKATAYPDIWYGIWSGPDSINADHGPRPGETFYHLPTPGTDFPVMNLNLHACYIAALVKLCGIEPGPGGDGLEPALSFARFQLKTPVLELKVNENGVVYEKADIMKILGQ